MLGTEHKEFLEDGKVLLFARNGIYQARVYKGDRRYIYRTLKTRDLVEARRLAIRFLHEIEFRRDEELPLQQKTFNAVIDEYVLKRQREYERSQLSKTNSSTKQPTSIHMLRQIKRVVKFWREYCGKKPVNRIDDKVLSDYVEWRKDYYHRMPPHLIPQNARLNPADKTLAWEIGLGKSLLKFAHERGYRGKAQLPTWNFRRVKKIVRPAFTISEYATIYHGFRRWIREVPHEFAEQRYTRELLRDYIHILASSGMRVGEANSLKVSDVVEFKDELGRRNYQFHVKGKTGARVVIPRVSVVPHVEMILRRNQSLKHFKGKVHPRQRKVENKGEWFFRMFNGEKIITLIDQFQGYLESIGMRESRHGDKFTLYSLRHFYASRMLGKGMPVFDISRNMGTGVDVIEHYYGKSVTPMSLATRLGD